MTDIYNPDIAIPEIPQERLDRNPLMTKEGYRNFLRIEKSRFAPLWNYEVGDRVVREDLPLIEAYRRLIAKDRPTWKNEPPPEIIEWIESLRESVIIFRENLPEGFDIERDWAHIPTMSREDLATRIEEIVPSAADISRLIVYDTSGATGHALKVPQNPGAVAKNHPLLDHALNRYNALPTFGPEMVACFNVGSEGATVVFPNVFTAWRQAGFAKINIHENSWKERADCHRFFEELKPAFLTGDPLAFDKMMEWEISAKPLAMVSTAVTLSPGLKKRIEEFYDCPVIDFYSTTETGPIAYSAPDGEGFSILPPDLYVEVVDEDGYPVSEGERGEITVTGGRNPYIPLLRYRTGDFGGIDYRKRPGADPAPRIHGLEARAPVIFKAIDGSSVHPIDIGREMRRVVFVQHEFIQRRDGSLDIAIRPSAGAPPDVDAMEEAIRSLFGKKQIVRVAIDKSLGDRMKGSKTIPYLSEIGE